VSIIGSKSSANGLKKLFSACPGLTVVSIRHSVNLTTQVLADFVASGPQLTRIDLRYCDLVEWSVLPTIAQHCPNLDTLIFISSSQRGPKASEMASVGQLQNLRYVNFRPKEPTKLFTALAVSRLPKLEKLSLFLEVRQSSPQCSFAHRPSLSFGQLL